MADQDTHAARLAAAIRAHEPLAGFPEDLSIADAYALQHRVTAVRARDGIGGIKAGVTAPSAQKFFGLDCALLGSLYADGQRESGCELPYLEGRAIECETAVFLNESGEPAAIAPAIEIVFVRFAQPADMTAANLVACNLCADLFIVGDTLEWDAGFANTQMLLRRDGETVNETVASEAIGGPEKAAAWMWREARRRKFDLGAQTLLLTGACGAVVPALPGRYDADFGRLGRLGFDIAADDIAAGGRSV